MLTSLMLPRRPLPRAPLGANQHAHLTTYRIRNFLALFSSIPFSFFTLRTLLRNGRSTTPFNSSASALFLSPWGCGGIHPILVHPGRSSRSELAAFPRITHRESSSRISRSVAYPFSPSRNDMRTKGLQPIWNHIVTCFLPSRPFGCTSLRQTPGVGGGFLRGTDRAHP